MQWQWPATDSDAFEEGGIGTLAAECQTLKFIPPWEEVGCLAMVGWESVEGAFFESQFRWIDGNFATTGWQWSFTSNVW